MRHEVRRGLLREDSRGLAFRPTPPPVAPGVIRQYYHSPLLAFRLVEALEDGIVLYVDREHGYGPRRPTIVRQPPLPQTSQAHWLAVLPLDPLAHLLTRLVAGLEKGVGRGQSCSCVRVAIPAA